MNVSNIPISKIKINERLWEVDIEKIKPLADSIKKIGLISPITLLEDKDGYVLVAGEHRLNAYKYNNDNEIPAIVHKREYDNIELDKAKCVIIEADENLIRRKPDGFEEGYILAKRKEAYEKLYPQTTQKEKVKSALQNTKHTLLKSSQADNATMASPEITKSFIQDTAEKTGIAPRTISTKVKVAERIDAEDGFKADSLGIGIAMMDRISASSIEVADEAKVAAKTHIDTIQMLSSENEFKYADKDKKKQKTIIGKRNQFFEDSMKKLKSEKPNKYHLEHPQEFAEELRDKIFSEYLPIYKKDKEEVVEDVTLFKKTENILICTTLYIEKYGVIDSFIKIYVNKESHFDKANNIANTFGNDDKVVIVCSSDSIFSNYINYIFKKEGE